MTFWHRRRILSAWQRNQPSLTICLWQLLGVIADAKRETWREELELFGTIALEETPLHLVPATMPPRESTKS